MSVVVQLCWLPNTSFTHSSRYVQHFSFGAISLGLIVGSRMMVLHFLLAIRDGNTNKKFQKKKCITVGGQVAKDMPPFAFCYIYNAIVAILRLASTGICSIFPSPRRPSLFSIVPQGLEVCPLLVDPAAYSIRRCGDGNNCCMVVYKYTPLYTPRSVLIIRTAEQS